MSDSTLRWPGWAVIRRQWRFGLFVYVLTLAVVLPAAAAVGSLMHYYFGHREVGMDVAARISLVPLTELVAEEPAAVTAIIATVAVAGLAWVILQAFVTGAVLASARAGAPVTLRAALAWGGQHFWGLLGLGLMGVPFVLAVAGLALAGAGKLSAALTEGMTSTATAIAIRYGLVFVALVIAAWASGTFDLMRARKVDGAGVFRAFGAGLWRGARGPLRLLSRTLPWILSAWLLTMVISLLDARLPWTTTGAIITGVVMQQALVLMRVFLRFGGLGAVQSLVLVEPR